MFRDCTVQVALKVGSDAAKAGKIRQGRKAATVSRHFRVPSGYLAGAGCSGQAGMCVSTEGARPTLPRRRKTLTTDDPTYPSARYDDALYTRRGFRRRVHIDVHSVLLIFTAIGLSAMGWGYFSSLKPISLVVNRQTRTVLSNQTTVAGVLADAAISLAPEDIVFPGPDAPVPDDQYIHIRFALPLQVTADGDTFAHRTQRQTIGDALGEAGVLLKQGDRIFLNGQYVEAKTPLARDESDNPFSMPPTLSIAVQRAIPVQVNDNGAVTTFYTTAPTLGEALRQAGLIVYLGDYVSPDLGTRVTPGWQVYIRRSRPASLMVDGKTIQTRTREDTVAGLLAQEGIRLENQDYAVPPATAKLTDGMNVTVTRVREEVITEREYLPYETVWQADPTMELDERKVTQIGVQGVKKRQIRTRYENGREVRRALDREWIDSAPVTQLISYGTKVVVRDLTLPDGSVVSYWRKISLLATSYTAATSGKARTHPLFGKTFLGWQAGTGIVAVDPSVVNLRATLYIPGYGLGQAGDTGGRIKGRRIDLGYDEENLVYWYKWVDVYELAPVPPSDQIRFVLPALPGETR